MYVLSIAQLADLVRERYRHLAAPERLLLGIAGPPAAGKSTFARQLEQELNAGAGRDMARVAPMDGFHLSSAELQRRGLLSHKGAPNTFAAENYVSALRLVKQVPRATVRLPLYDRTRHEPFPDAITLDVRTDIVITEGNYLLLPFHPWEEINRLADMLWYVSISRDLAAERLIQRHVRGGKTPEEAFSKTHASDLANFDLVEEHKRRAHWLLSATVGDAYNVAILRSHEARE